MSTIFRSSVSMNTPLLRTQSLWTKLLAVSRWSQCIITWNCVFCYAWIISVIFSQNCISQEGTVVNWERNLNWSLTTLEITQVDNFIAYCTFLKGRHPPFWTSGDLCTEFEAKVDGFACVRHFRLYKFLRFTFLSVTPADPFPLLKQG